MHRLKEGTGLNIYDQINAVKNRRTFSVTAWKLRVPDCTRWNSVEIVE